MQTIPLKQVPNQTIRTTLGGQSCQINIYTLSTGLYLDLLVNGAAILTGAICEDRNLIVREAYLGFVGDLAFMDTQGTEDPQYTGLGERWVLLYLSPADLA
jgi:hypothetical protein